MRHLTIFAAVLLTACATTNQQAITKWQDAKYNRCLDRVHAEAKTRTVNWRLEVDACMGQKGEEFDAYQAAKDTKLPPRWSIEVTP